MFRSMLAFFAVVSLSVLAACPATTSRPVTAKATTDPTPHAVAPTATVTGTTPKPNVAAVAAAKKVAGVSCQQGSECESGTCEGLGCDEASPGKCAPAKRMCTMDLRTFCGCDGKTFQGSGSCPKHRYKAAGPCPTNVKSTP